MSLFWSFFGCQKSGADDRYGIPHFGGPKIGFSGVKNRHFGGQKWSKRVKNRVFGVKFGVLISIWLDLGQKRGQKWSFLVKNRVFLEKWTKMVKNDDFGQKMGFVRFSVAGGSKTRISRRKREYDDNVSNLI